MPPTPSGVDGKFLMLFISNVPQTFECLKSETENEDPSSSSSLMNYRVKGEKLLPRPFLSVS